MLFLGLALARPLGCTDRTLAGLAEKTGLHVFIIDNSYSMAYEANRPDAKTHLDQAKQIARQMISRLSSGGESVVVITAGAPATAIIAHPSYDLDGASQAVSRIEQTAGATDIVGALQRASDIAREEGKQPIKKLYILSDSTRSAWDGPQTAQMKNLGLDLAKNYRITYFDLGRRDQWNQTVLQINPVNHLVTTRFNNDFVAIAKGYGSGPESLLQWKLDGQPLPGARTIRLDLNTPPQLQSNAAIKSGGPHVLSASLASEDRLRIDNDRYRVIDTVSELKTLIVEGDRGVGVMSGSAAFLQLALAPPSETSANGQPGKSDSYVAPEVISDLELGNKVLADYRAVILTNVGQLQAQQADALQKFVKSGGALLIFTGEQVNADNYNTILLPRGLIPGALTKRISVGSDERGYTFDFKPQTVHPLLSVFRGEEKSGLDRAEVFTYWQLDLPKDTKAERVLNYVNPKADGQASNDPAVTTHQLGQGHVVFVTTSASADWTTLPAKLNYVTFVQELLSGSVAPDDAWMNLTVGQALEVPPTVKLTSAPSLFDASKKQLPIQETALAGGQNVYRSQPIEHPGLYTLSVGDRTYPVAVNVPAEEADVRTLEPAAIKSALGDIDLTIETDQAPTEISKNDPGRDFGWAFMCVLLALAASECFMAMTFGHYRKAVVKPV